MRHLVEEGHPWSETVRSLIDVRHNYGTRPQGDRQLPCIVGTVIRFFPRGRQTSNARVKRWGRRDLLAEADAGRTRACRPKRTRYQRTAPQMSASTAVATQAADHNWVLLQVGRTLRPTQEKNLATLYADIPRQHLLNALRADLATALTLAHQRGHSTRRATRRWIDLAARTLAHRFGDDRRRVAGGQEARAASDDHVDGHIDYHRILRGRAPRTYPDGFTNLWRKALWAALRAEQRGGSCWGWMLLERFTSLAVEARAMGKEKPNAWAWSVIKREGFEEVLRDFGG